jgi:hypothetical protein
MVTEAIGFLASQLSLHFQAHGNDFDASSADAYETMAISFMNRILSAQMRECCRPQGDRIRFDTNTDAFCIIDNTGIVRTYYKPVPCASLPAESRNTMRLAGLCHCHASNQEYFEAECKRKWPR